jgi:hypothetical protein
MDLVCRPQHGQVGGGVRHGRGGRENTSYERHAPEPWAAERSRPERAEQGSDAHETSGRQGYDRLIGQQPLAIEPPV